MSRVSKEKNYVLGSAGFWNDSDQVFQAAKRDVMPCRNRRVIFLNGERELE